MIKWLTNKIKKALIKEFDLRDIYNYVNEDNELDIKVISLFKKRTKDLRQLNSLRKTVAKYGKYQEAIEKDIAIFKKNSHPPIEGLERRLLKLEKIKKEK